MILSPQRQLELLLRNDLLAFAQKVFAELNPGRVFESNWHHEAMSYWLTRTAVDAQLNRLLINVPPRSLKSIMVTVALPAYLLGRDPTKKIITVCYNQELANDFSRKTRQVMRSKWYRDLFPSTAIVGSGAETAFYTTEGGFRIATSVEGTLTGRGGDVVIIDDPQKASDALSETRRNSVYSWLTETIFTRLDDKRTGSIILVQQRLHEDDLSGKLLASGEWAPLIIPAIATREYERICLSGDPFPRFHIRVAGDLLDPVREPQHVLDSLRRDMGTALFLAQYQQDPLPPEGDVIKVAWFKRFRDLPNDGEMIFSIDTASKAGERNDWSVIIAARFARDRLYIEYVLRRRMEYPELLAQVKALADHMQPDRIVIEDKASGMGLIQDLKLADRHYPVVAYDPGGIDKETRMKIQAAKIENGRVLLPPEAPFIEEFLAEMQRFPNGKYDDQVDALSQLIDYAFNRSVGKLIVWK